MNEDFHFSDSDEFNEELFNDGPPVMSYQEAEQKSRDLVEGIKKHHSALKGILDRHESNIRIRWDKKSDDKKRDILREAWSDIPAISRPDVGLWLKREVWLKDKVNKTEAYMWPYISLEDLVKQNIFLIFLNARGRHEPHEFVDADLEVVQVGTKVGAIKPVYVNGYAMRLYGEASPETYGKLVPSDDQEGGIVGQTGVHTGYGLKVLEIQEHTLKFLHKCCTSILRMGENIFSGETRPEPEPLIATDSEYASLQTTANMLPYRIPADVNFTRLLALARAESDSRKDFIWALREDPGIFAEILEETSEHQAIYVSHGWGNKKIVPLRSAGNHAAFWNIAIQNTVKEAYWNFAIFHELDNRIKTLHSLSQKYEDIQWPAKEVPSDYRAAYQAVRYLLAEVESHMGAELARTVSVSPPLRDKMEVTFEEQQEDRYIADVSNICKGGGSHAVHLLVELLRLLFTQEEFRVRTLHVVLEDIEQLIGKDGKDRYLITPRVESGLSPLLYIAECQRQLYHFQPWTWQAEQDMVTKEEKFRAEYEAAFVEGWEMDETALKKLHIFGNPTDKRFYYPAEQRRTALNIGALRSAEEKLDRLWEFIDNHVQNKNKKTYHDLVANRLGSNRTIRRTPVWIQPKAIDKSIKPIEYEFIPLPATKHEVESQLTGNFQRSLVLGPQLKEKTRPAVDPAAPVNEDAAVLEPEAAPSRVITVDRRTYDVVEALFHSPLNDNPPGDIPWADLLRAFTRIGFSVEKLGGSAWHFEPDPEKTGVEEAINLHDPHKSKLPTVWARNIGRRLTMKYGWTVETFRLE